MYKILNTINGKIYIGSTSDSFKNRVKAHFSMLRRNRHPNVHLQGAFNKYGEESFEFSILYFGDSLKEIRDKEQEYITSLNVCNSSIGYNLDPDVYRSLRNAQTNAKISETLKRKYASGEISITHRESPLKGRKNP